jgi:ACR3 family arsenite efflux pump ArsB
LLLGGTDISVPWETLVLATVLYVVLPRRRLGASKAIKPFEVRAKPWSITRVQATVVIRFGLQGEMILNHPGGIVLIAAPCAMIGTSKFSEPAVAVAISLFGLNSGAALTTVVGVLVEEPVMLTLVAFANRIVDVMEELVKFTSLTRDICAHLMDRYSGRVESHEELSKRESRARRVRAPSWVCAKPAFNDIRRKPP